MGAVKTDPAWRPDRWPRARAADAPALSDSRAEIPEGAGQGIGSGSRIPRVSNNRVKKMGIEDFVKMGGGVIKK